MSEGEAMTCGDVVVLVEAIAAGDLAADAGVARHLATCPGCADAMRRARQIEQALRVLASPPPPTGFVQRVVTRVRGERLRTERYVDAGFNVAMAGGLLVTLAGFWMLFSLSGVAVITGDLVRAAGQGVRLVADRASSGAPAFLGAVGLLMSALVLWGWADRRWEF